MMPRGLAARALRVESGEGRPVGLMMALNFLICFGAVGVQTAGFALFLERFGPSQIAGAYLVSAAGSTVAAAIYLVASGRIPFPRLTRTVMLVVAVGTAVEWAGARVGLGVVIAVLALVVVGVVAGSPDAERDLVDPNHLGPRLVLLSIILTAIAGLVIFSFSSRNPLVRALGLIAALVL